VRLVSFADTAERIPATQFPRSGNPAQCSASAILAVAMALYSVSLVKFYVRNPLAEQTGPQGPIELSLVILAGVTLLAAFRRPDWKLLWTPSAKAFFAFGALAALSSLFSYYPLLSLLKGVSLLFVCGIAVIATSAFRTEQVIRYNYYCMVIILLTGLALKLAGGGPYLAIDGYSGRARFTMFAWHPGTLADLCAMTLLSGFLLSRRPPIWCQAFLLAINIAAASRASSAILVVILIAIGLASVRFTPGVLFLGCCLGAMFALAMLVVVQRQYEAHDLVSIGQGLYGDKLDQDLTTFSGRREVWGIAQPLIAHSLLLGYGLDGARDVLIHNASWDAGNTHNSLIDLILAGGLPATLLFLFGWVGAARRAWRSPGLLRIGAIGTYAYIACFGIVSPNLTYLQGLATFLILTIDVKVCAQLSPAHQVARKYFSLRRQSAPRRPATSASVG
jgi:hypothetical protein